MLFVAACQERKCAIQKSNSELNIKLHIKLLFTDLLHKTNVISFTQQ